LPWIKRISAKTPAFNELKPRTVEKKDVCVTINSAGLGATRQCFVQYDKDYKNLSKEQKRVYDLQLAGESMKACGDRLKQNISGVGRIKLNNNKPSNTVTTKPELWHPKEKRSLSIGELKIICSFPYDYYLGDTFSKKWERLGRSVPPLMMYAIAKHIYKTILK
jgi:site-specific DNA-cytosine methylase